MHASFRHSILPTAIACPSRSLSVTFTARSPRTYPQKSLPASYYRGGTSRAIIFRTEDLPRDRETWGQIFLGCIGSPDLYGRQLDGLGGGISSLSKVCVVGKSERPDADVDYTFVAIGVRDDSTDYSSNCGNMSAAIGPFAVDCGMFEVPATRRPADEPAQVTVRIHNTNTGKIIHSTFPVIHGEAAASGDYSIDGVSGTAAKTRLDFVDPSGSRTGKLLPTGAVTDVLGGGIPATLLDVGNPCCFVRASDLGVVGNITPQEMEAHPSLTGTLEALRREAGVLMGLASTLEGVPGSVPKITMVSPPCHDDMEGGSPHENGLVVARAMSVGQPHRAIPVTVALATAAAAKLQGTIVAECVRGGQASDAELDIMHASGRLGVDAKYAESGKLEVVTVFRTARRLFDGRVYWK